MNQLTLALFGTFQVRLNEEAVVAFQSNKARALLAYLAVEAAQPHARTTLAGLFWPEYPEKYARDNLRHALTNLRKVLHNAEADPPFLLTYVQQVQFNSQSRYHLDVAEFSRAVKTGSHHQPPSGETPIIALAALEQAVTLYRGSFLQGFFLADCSAFEEWLLLTRERFHNQMLTAFATLTEHFENAQAFD